MNRLTARETATGSMYGGLCNDSTELPATMFPEMLGGFVLPLKMHKLNTQIVGGQTTSISHAIFTLVADVNEKLAARS